MLTYFYKNILYKKTTMKMKHTEYTEIKLGEFKGIPIYLWNIRGSNSCFNRIHNCIYATPNLAFDPTTNYHEYSHYQQSIHKIKKHILGIRSYCLLTLYSPLYIICYSIIFPWLIVVKLVTLILSELYIEFDASYNGIKTAKKDAIPINVTFLKNAYKTYLKTNLFRLILAVSYSIYLMFIRT